MVTIRNITSASAIVALSVLAACSRGGSPASDTSAKVTPQERQYSFKDGEEELKVSIPGADIRGEAKVVGKSGEFTVSDICVKGESDDSCQQVALIIRKNGGESRQVLYSKNQKGELSPVCELNEAQETVEAAYGTLIADENCKAGLTASKVEDKAKEVGGKVEDAAKDVGAKVEGAAQDVKEKVEEATK